MKIPYNPDIPLDRQTQKFFQMAMDESERGLILIVTSDIDAKLEKILKAYLKPSRVSDDNIFKHQGALGSFSNRIEMAHRLGIIDSSFANSIDSLRKSRNRMAHELDETLDESPHKDHLNNSIEQVKKSKTLSAFVEVYYKNSARLKEHTDALPSSPPILQKQFGEGREKVRAIHMILSVLLDTIYKLIESDIEKSQIHLGLESYDKDILRYESFLKKNEDN